MRWFPFQDARFPWGGRWSSSKGRHAKTTTSCRNACKAHILWGLSSPATPTGVEHFPFQWIIM